MALAIDSSSPAAVSSSTTTVTSPSFTAPANSLIVVSAAIGNSSGSGLTTGTITDSLGSTWTMKRRQNASGFGSAEIWMLDAGSSAVARTVTLTGNGTTGKGVVLAVTVFTGAETVASQTGASNGTSTSAWTITLTASRSNSSHVIGATSRSTSAVAGLTPNTSTTITGSLLDSSNGESYVTWRSTNLASGVSTIYGFTNGTSATQEHVCYEVMVSTAAPPTTISSGDTGSGSDAVAGLTARLSSADTGTGADAASIAATTSTADSGTFTESATIRVTDGDTGTGTEGAAVGVPIHDGDTGTVTDAVAALSATLTASDTGTLVDAGAVRRPVSDGDVGSFTDAASVIKNARPTDGDSGQFRETASVAQFGQFFRPPAVVENHIFHARVSRQQSVGVTVLKKSGAYTAISDPTAEQVGTADIAYLGGRDYLIDDTEKAALIAAGYGSFIITKAIA